MDLTNLPQLIDGKYVAEIVGCSYVQALRIMRKIGAIKINKLVRVERDAFLNYLNGNKEVQPIKEEVQLIKGKNVFESLPVGSISSWVLSIDGSRILVECECKDKSCDWCKATNK